MMCATVWVIFSRLVGIVFRALGLHANKINKKIRPFCFNPPPPQGAGFIFPVAGKANPSHFYSAEWDCSIQKTGQSMTEGLFADSHTAKGDGWSAYLSLSVPLLLLKFPLRFFSHFCHILPRCTLFTVPLPARRT